MVYSISSLRGADGELLYPDGVEKWRLEAAMLTEGMSQPWPCTLVQLIEWR